MTDSDDPLDKLRRLEEQIDKERAAARPPPKEEPARPVAPDRGKESTRDLLPTIVEKAALDALRPKGLNRTLRKGITAAAAVLIGMGFLWSHLTAILFFSGAVGGIWWGLGRILPDEEKGSKAAEDDED